MHKYHAEIKQCFKAFIERYASVIFRINKNYVLFMHEVPTTPIGSKKSRLFFNKKKTEKRVFLSKKSHGFFRSKKVVAFFRLKKTTEKRGFFGTYWCGWYLIVIFMVILRFVCRFNVFVCYFNVKWYSFLCTRIHAWHKSYIFTNFIIFLYNWMYLDRNHFSENGIDLLQLFQRP